MTDCAGRPRILLISPGNVSDMTMAPSLIEAARGRFDRLIADKGYDTNAIRAAIQS
jgi:transposase